MPSPACCRAAPPRLSSGRRICDLIYIHDLVAGLLLAAVRHELTGDVIDLGTGVGTPIREAVELIVELTGSPCRPLFGALPDRLDERPQIADIERTERLLGFTPRWSLRAGLAETIAWYRSQPTDAG
jgi:UDP-glucose 4-epimerase